MAESYAGLSTSVWAIVGGSEYVLLGEEIIGCGVGVGVIHAAASQRLFGVEC